MAPYIHTINSTIPTKDDNNYEHITLNPYAIIVMDEDPIDEVIQDDSFKEVILKHLKTQHLFDKALLYTRSIHDDDVIDNTYKISDIMTWKTL